MRDIDRGSEGWVVGKSAGRCREVRTGSSRPLVKQNYRGPPWAGVSPAGAWTQARACGGADRSLPHAGLACG